MKKKFAQRKYIEQVLNDELIDDFDPFDEVSE